MATTSPHWVCQTCKQPITDGRGTIEIINTNPELGPVGGYPREATPEVAPVRTDSGFIDTVGTLEVLRDHKSNVDLLVYHTERCDPHPDTDGYHFDVNRAATLEHWCGWVFHLFDKTWMGRDDVQRLLAFWWDHNGQRLPDP